MVSSVVSLELLSKAQSLSLADNSYTSFSFFFLPFFYIFSFWSLGNICHFILKICASNLIVDLCPFSKKIRGPGETIIIIVFILSLVRSST